MALQSCVAYNRWQLRQRKLVVLDLTRFYEYLFDGKLNLPKLKLRKIERTLMNGMVSYVLFGTGKISPQTHSVVRIENRCVW